MKAGFILRGYGEDLKQELLGRRIQLFTALVAFAVAIPIVWFAHTSYFAQNLLPPVAWVYAKTIEAGSQTSIALSLLIWAIPGAIIQWVGGATADWRAVIYRAINQQSDRRVGGFDGDCPAHIDYPMLGEKARSPMLIGAAGFIAGDALYSFFTSILSGKGK